MGPESKPLVVAHGSDVEQSGVLVFVTATREISIEGHRDEILRILRWCNGQRSLEEIKGLSKISDPLFSELVGLLESEKIICDSRKLFESSVETTEYPLLSAHDLTQADVVQITTEINSLSFPKGKRFNLPATTSRLATIAGRRKSCRAFKPEALSLEKLAGILAIAYGKIKHTKSVPSAGGLYPSRIYLAVLKNCAELSSGVYEYDFTMNQLIMLRDDLDVSEIFMLVDSSSIARDATAVLFIGSRIQEVARKYSNRALRYALIEAGHIAQNVYLYCAENDIGVVEYGGFNDKLCAKFFGLDYPREAVLLSMVLGTPDREASDSYREAYSIEEQELRKALVGKKKPITRHGYRSYRYKTYRMPRYVAWSSFARWNKNSSRNDVRFNQSTGTGVSMQEASVKSMAEAFERYCSGVVRFDVFAKEDELGGQILDIDAISPLRDEYRDRTGLAKRNRAEPLEWVKATDVLEGQSLYVPADQVFYPLYQADVGRRLTYLANSTGIAAHFDSQTAIEKGLLELIERDAIAVTWYGRRVPNRISVEALDESTLNRKVRFEKLAKVQVDFIDLTLDSVPVIACVIKSESYPHWTTGFGASRISREALEKAFDEAEIMYHSWRNFPKKRREVSKENVTGVLDHMCFWAKKENRPDIEWITGAPATSGLPRDFLDYRSLIEKFRPAVIDLSLPDVYSKLKVVKVASPILMPINFGYMSEHYGHPRVNIAGYEWGWGYPAMPHFLA